MGIGADNRGRSGVECGWGLWLCAGWAGAGVSGGGGCFEFDSDQEGEDECDNSPR